MRCSVGRLDYARLLPTYPFERVSCTHTHYNTSILHARYSLLHGEQLCFVVSVHSRFCRLPPCSHPVFGAFSENAVLYVSSPPLLIFTMVLLVGQTMPPRHHKHKLAQICSWYLPASHDQLLLEPPSRCDVEDGGLTSLIVKLHQCMSMHSWLRRSAPSPRLSPLCQTWSP